ncbi:FAD:protein FMN transferase [Neolewinella agarilytica]|uniref:FAD:protein FMN transferase n=1 Tax=Neolewinella agarilytica TaxID=478744 RepID=A0A1H9NJ82_9BACT|nr:FAD:protein FMN transferase [Neolewinella agarilytica]SER36044.1 thiamine biosynthesis lipoprotein [Neolewinella agarilytica]
MRILPLLLLGLVLCTCDRASVSSAVAGQAEQPLHILEGAAMGTYYRVTYLGDTIPALKNSLDSLLDAYNQELSAWVPGSKINAFNESESGISLAGTEHFIPNLTLARAISEKTGGAYDPTVGPLVKYWGFGTAEKRTDADGDPAEIARLLKLVGIEKLQLDGEFLRKPPGVELNLNASAKGYGVDLLSQLLSQRGRPDHLIDIGGEMRGGGQKNGRPWNVAIRLPDENRAKVASAGTLPLSGGRAIATSGNYLDYYKVEGKTLSHTIDPRTGKVERNRLLSASVLAPDCATADAYATACLVLGPEEALELINTQPELEGYFIILNQNDELETVTTDGLKE